MEIVKKEEVKAPVVIIEQRKFLIKINKSDLLSKSDSAQVDIDRINALIFEKYSQQQALLRMFRDWCELYEIKHSDMNDYDLIAQFI